MINTNEEISRSFRTVAGTDGRTYEVDADGVARYIFRDAEQVCSFRFTEEEEAALEEFWYGDVD